VREDTDQRLVVDIAREYEERCSLGLEDLIEVGRGGLVKAKEKSAPEKGRDWQSYASWWIRQRITLAIAQSTPNLRDAHQ